MLFLYVPCFPQANDAYLRFYAISPDGSQRLGLSFPLNSNHFMISNGNRVRLKCLASISDLYWKSAEITLLQEKPKFASVVGTNGGGVSESNNRVEEDEIQDQFNTSPGIAGTVNEKKLCLNYLNVKFYLKFALSAFAIAFS